MKSLGVGGNLHDGVAQWIERQFAELNVAGSSPVTVAFLFLASLCAVFSLMIYVRVLSLILTTEEMLRDLLSLLASCCWAVVLLLLLRSALCGCLERL